MKRNTALVAAVVMGFLAVFMVYSYVTGVKQAVTRDLEPVKVMVAREPLAKGQLLNKSQLAFRSVPKKFVGDRAIKSAEEVDLVIGQPLRYNLQEGQPVLWSDVGEEKEGGLASMVGKGERAVTIAITDITGVGGLIRPNDHVDILGTFPIPPEYGGGKEAGPAGGEAPANPGEFKEMLAEKLRGAAPDAASVKSATITLLQNVTVLATGRSFGEPGEALPGSREGYSHVTFLVTPTEVEMLTFAQTIGELSLSLRKPDDLEILEDLPKMTSREIFDQILPRKLTKERKERIEVIRGGQAEKE